MKLFVNQKIDRGQVCTADKRPNRVDNETQRPLL